MSVRSGVNDAFDGLKLLGEIEARPPGVEHGEDRYELALRLLQALDDFRV